MLNTQLIPEDSQIPNEISNYLDINDYKCESEIQKLQEEFDMFKIVRNYMEGKSERGLDLSYEWIVKEPNIALINKSIVLDIEKLKTILNIRDLTCELKVLITNKKLKKQFKFYFLI